MPRPAPAREAMPSSSPPGCAYYRRSAGLRLGLLQFPPNAGGARRRLGPAVERDPEGIAQPGASALGQPQRPAVAQPCDPAEFEAAAANLGADMAGDVVAALAPVETGSAVDAPRRRLEHGAEPPE